MPGSGWQKSPRNVTKRDDISIRKTIEPKPIGPHFYEPISRTPNDLILYQPTYPIRHSISRPIALACTVYIRIVQDIYRNKRKKNLSRNLGKIDSSCVKHSLNTTSGDNVLRYENQRGISLLNISTWWTNRQPSRHNSGSRFGQDEPMTTKAESLHNEFFNGIHGGKHPQHPLIGYVY